MKSAETPAPGGGPTRLYALFVHYVLHAGSDWSYNEVRQIELSPGTRPTLQSNIESLHAVLQEHDGWEGFAYLFLDPGWTDLIEGVGDPAVLGSTLTELGQGLRDLVVRRPIRIVTAADLILLRDLLRRNADPAEGQALGELLAGDEPILRYDAPKVIEAVIRIANFSRNVPILRFDHDVVFADSNPGGQDKIRHNILKLCERFRELADHPDRHYFLFSGSYLEPIAGGPLEDESALWPLSVEQSCNAFATRVLQLAKLPSPVPDEERLAEKPAVLDKSTTARFLRSLWQVGANPFRQVTSGAGLCLSDSAILDLPPYSNMRRNVMWIDDHLKFALHHELRHFGLLRGKSNLEDRSLRLPGIGRVPEAWFEQDRYPKSERPDGPHLADVRLHIYKYLPRLLRGCIVDSWMREDARLKRGVHQFDDVEEWRQLHQKRARSEYATHFLEALAQGLAIGLTFDETIDPDRLEGHQRASWRAEWRMRERLWKRGRQRLDEIVRLWGGKEYSGTFLYLAVHGATASHDFDSWSALGFLPEEFSRGLAAAVAELDDSPGNAAEGTLGALLDDLIQDFLEYITLVRFWKTFVQSTRFLLNTRKRDEDFWAFPVELRGGTVGQVGGPPE